VRESEGPLSSGKLFINPATYEVYLGEERVTLTSTEFRLLHLLVKNRGMVVAHQTLERALWGEDVDSSRLVKKYVQRLRRKLGDDAREPQWIASVHGVGYRFIGPPPGVPKAEEAAYAR
jgi:DNA-binding response OmpR family regulator